MNRYPLWKYIVIALAIIVSALYAVPNLFGEVPAVQVAGTRATFKVDDALRTKLQDALKAANVNVTETEQEGDAVRFRVADTDTQLRARDVLQKNVSNGFVVALNLVPNSPHWLQAIGFEWLNRLSHETRRLFRRYVVDGAPFALRLFWDSARQRLHSPVGT